MYDEDKQAQTNEPTPAADSGSVQDTPLKEQEEAATSDKPDLSNEEALERIQAGLDKATSQPEVQEGFRDFFKGDQPPQSFGEKAQFISKNKGLLAGVGGGLVGLVLAIGALLGFLNSFTLDNLMTNIEAKSFIRFQVAMDGRSTKWVQAYLLIRMGEVENPNLAPGDRNNGILFKADRVDNNKPLTDWYRTMRSSRFEQDLLERSGISFSSYRGPDGKIRPAVVRYSDREVRFEPTEAEIRAIENGNVNEFNGRLRQFVDVEVLGNDKEARRVIKQAVRDNTRWWEVVKRRHIRQDIQNRTGIRDWRFFENTRDKIDEKKIDIRNKIVTKAFPDTNKAGVLIQCLFGITPGDPACAGSRDPADPANRSSNTPTPTDGEREGTTEFEGEPGPDGTPTTERSKLSSVAIKSLISRFVPFVNAVELAGTLDMLSASIDSLGKIGPLITSYKSAQAMGLFTTFNIARDQAKTGEMTGEEYGALMSLANNVSSNEYYAKVVADQPSTASAASEELQNAKNKDEFCSPEFQDKLKDPKNAQKVNDLYIYNCPEKQLGGVTGAASGIEAFMSSPVGTALKAVSDAWKTISDNILGDLFRNVSSLLGSIIGAVSDSVLSVLGLKDDIQKLTEVFIEKMAELAGIKPIIDDTPIPITGQYVNAIGQGGAATAENSLRAQGASITTQQSRKEAADAVAAYTQQEINNQSLITKYASLSNPNSFSTKTLLSINSSKNKVAALPSKLTSGVFGLFSFSKPSFAAQDPYAASSFAGIQTFDYPKQCTDQDPLTATPQSSTNIQTILPGKVTNSELTWELVTKKDAWYDFLYQKIGERGDADEVATKVYNCALLDNAVRGGLGGVYGYTADGGLGSNAAGANTTPIDGAPGGSVSSEELGPFVFPLATTQKALKNMDPNWCWDKKSPTCHGTESFKYYASDIFAPIGTTVVAATAGEVIKTNTSSFGLSITIRGNDCGNNTFTCMGKGSIFLYNHLKPGSAKVKTGQKVAAGTVIGVVGDRGDTGNGSLQHLHFDVTSRKFSERQECQRSNPGACEVSGLLNVQPMLYESFKKLSP